MKFVFLFTFLIVSISAADTRIKRVNASASNDAVDEVIKILTDVEKFVPILPLLGDPLETVCGAVITILHGIKLLIGLFLTTGALFGLLTGDLSSVNQALSGLVTTVGAVGSILGLGN